jgi:uncharacterized protein (DUF305 family)
MRKTPATAALVVVLAVTLTACGDDGGSDTPSTTTEVSATEHNDADVAFATDMIQHHAQALSMVDMTMSRDLDPETQALADDIRAAQAPEIESMADWLQEWGEDIPETVRDHANAGHDGEHMDGGEMSDSEMPGMMSAEDMKALGDAADAEFQDMWLEMMIEHHEGAVQMAETEIADGRFRPAVELAADIVESQTAEIEKMQALLS